MTVFLKICSMATGFFVENLSSTSQKSTKNGRLAISTTHISPHHISLSYGDTEDLSAPLFPPRTSGGGSKPQVCGGEQIWTLLPPVGRDPGGGESKKCSPPRSGG